MVKKGFTMIELIIIFTIIMIMTAALMSTSYKDRAKKEVEATAREVVASIRETQNNALTGKSKGADSMPCAFQFSIIGNNSYQIRYDERDLDSASCNGYSSFFNPVQLPENITMEVIGYDANKNERPGVGTQIEFKVPYGDFKVLDHTDEYQGVEIIIQKSNKRYRICVHSTGLIEEKGFDDTEGSALTCVF
ncbi:MAG: hypothetical protein ACKUBY_01270 [Candidatus Moraniibacteriota bacterium]|jgi:type II secretory pathway pseudopilin PulG